MIKRFALVGRTSFGMCNVYSEMTSKARVSLQRVHVCVLCVDENRREKIKNTNNNDDNGSSSSSRMKIHRYLMVVRLLLLLQRLVLLPLVVVVIPLSRQFLCVSECSCLFHGDCRHHCCCCCCFICIHSYIQRERCTLDSCACVCSTAVVFFFVYPRRHST